MIQSVNHYPIRSIFDKDSKLFYYVPKYQREYVWTYSHWNALYNDIKENGEGYFIGSIICINTTKDSLAAPRLELVDGQQRLTTISLFLLALYVHLQVYKTELFEDEDNQAILANLRNSIKRKESPNGLIIVPQIQSHNADDYLYLMTEKKLTDKASTRYAFYPTRKIARCYNYFWDRLKADIEQVESPLEFLLKMYQKVTSAILVKIEVADHNEAYMLFESLNDRGTPLTAIDLMKNTILARADEQDIDNYYDKWKTLLESLTDDYHTQERFFRHYYNSFKRRHNAPFITEDMRSKEPLGIVATKSNMLAIYEMFIKRDLSGFLDDVTHCGEIYSSFITPSEAPSEYKAALFDLLRIQGVPADILLLYLFYNQERLNISTKMMNQIINLLVRFFVRRNATDYPATYALDRIFMALNNDIEDNNWTEQQIYDHIYEVLLANSATDERFRQQLSGDIYEEKVGVARFVLCKLCEKAMTTETWTDLWAKTDGPAKKTFKWTIEHIFPEGENIPQCWVDMIANGNRELANEYREHYVHKLGNLTITGYNSSLGNKSFEEKRDRKSKDNQRYIGYRNGLELNTEIAQKESWTIQDIKQRTEILVNQLLEVYKL